MMCAQENGECRIPTAGGETEKRIAQIAIPKHPLLLFPEQRQGTAAYDGILVVSYRLMAEGRRVTEGRKGGRKKGR
jgi:hypothetical protein